MIPITLTAFGIAFATAAAAPLINDRAHSNSDPAEPHDLPSRRILVSRIDPHQPQAPARTQTCPRAACSTEPV
jgi:hypothetical protein